jgi:hypothetical protein
MSRSGYRPVAFDHAKAYLTGAGACNRGKELVLQLRTGSLPLAPHTGKFSRSWQKGPSDTFHNCYPVCSTGIESVSRFLLDCPKYESVRGELWRRLEDETAPECCSRCRLRRKLTSCLLDFDILGGPLFADDCCPLCVCLLADPLEGKE